jgi:hypothetical protein
VAAGGREEGVSLLVSRSGADLDSTTAVEVASTLEARDNAAAAPQSCWRAAKALRPGRAELVVYKRSRGSGEGKLRISGHTRTRGHRTFGSGGIVVEFSPFVGRHFPSVNVVSNTDLHVFVDRTDNPWE